MNKTLRIKSCYLFNTLGKEGKQLISKTHKGYLQVAIDSGEVSEIQSIIKDIIKPDDNSAPCLEFSDYSGQLQISYKSF